MKLSFIPRKVKDVFKKPALFDKEIQELFKDKKGYIIVKFTDGTKGRFNQKYSLQLLKGNSIQFYARENGKWLNLIKDPKLKVIKESSEEIINGSLRIGYVSRFKNDSQGEYVFLPGCTLKPKGQKVIKTKGILYTESIVESSFEDIFSGYGRVGGEFIRRKDTVLIKKVSSFHPKTKAINLNVDLSEVAFHMNCISINTEYGIFDCASEDVPFEFSPAYSNLKNIYDGYSVKINIVQRKTGSVKINRNYPKSKNKWIETIKWVQHEDTEWDFSNVDAQKINTAIKDYKVKIEEHKKFIKEKEAAEIEKQKVEARYLELLDKIKKSNTFRSFSSLKKQFKSIGKSINDDELKDLFFHNGYDINIFEYLRDKSTETYVDNFSFVFRLEDEAGKSFFVWEVSKRTLATYVFSDDIEPEQLLARLKLTPRLEIRNNKEIQKSLGYKGFIIHTTYEAWIEKLASILKIN